MSFFFINNTFNFYVKPRFLTFRLRVCNYAKKRTTETVTAEMQPTGHLGYDPSQARDGALIPRTGTSYQTLVADNMRKTLNLTTDNGFKCINNVDKWTDPTQLDMSSPDISLIHDAITVGIEVKEVEQMSFGSTTLVHSNPSEAVETLLNAKKWPKKAKKKALKIMSNQIEDLINRFVGNKPNLKNKQKLKLSDVLAMANNDWLEGPFPYSQSQANKKKGYAPVKRTKLTVYQQELWLRVFAANLPRWIKTKNDKCVNKAYPEFLAQQRLNSTIFGGELLPFKCVDMTPDFWHDIVNKQHIFLGQRFLLPEDTSSATHGLTGGEAIRRFYRGAGSSYLQIKAKGLYHLGNDCLNLGVPLFDTVGCGCHVRLRIVKTSGKAPLFKGSPTLSFFVDKGLFKKNLKPSPYSLDGAEGFVFPKIDKSLFFTAFDKVKLLNLFTK